MQLLLYIVTNITEVHIRNITLYFPYLEICEEWNLY